MRVRGTEIRIACTGDISPETKSDRSNLPFCTRTRSVRPVLPEGDCDCEFQKLAPARTVTTSVEIIIKASLVIPSFLYSVSIQCVDA